MKSKEDINILFKQGNTDERILKSMSTDEEHQYNSEELFKAMNRSGLVQKEVQVQGKNGQTFTRKQWVKANEAQSTPNQSKAKDDVDDKKTKISSISQKGYRVSINNGEVMINTMVKPISERKVGTDIVCQFKGTDGKTYEVTRSANDGKTAPKVKSVKLADNTNSVPAEDTNSEDKKSVSSDKTPKSHWTKVGTSEQAKSQIAQMLASGKSREDCMADFKAQGVTWKESDNAGINWMRAAMAMNKHLTSGTSEQPKSTDNSVSKPKESKNAKSEVKSVVGSDYTQLTTEKESGTIEGEAHNMMVGKLGSEGKKKPTEKEIKAAATSLKDAAMKTVISSYNQDTLVHQLAIAKQFTKLAGGNMDHMTLENIYKDVVSGQGSYTQEQKCNALAKLCGKDYNSFDDDVRRYASNSLANVSITPKSKGYFDVKFSYDDGESRTERFDSVKSAKEAADKFIDKEEKYADEKESR